MYDEQSIGITDDRDEDLKATDLCKLYGHENCGGLEIDGEANIVCCDCWCHNEAMGHA